MENRPRTRPPTTPATLFRALQEQLAVSVQRLATATARVTGIVVEGFRLIWRLVRPGLRWALQVALALFILLEQWGWQPLAELLGRFARWRPWARLEGAISGLPPYAALVAFALPSVLLLPLKFVALFLIAKGQIVLAGLLFAAAKVGATALVARLFLLTRPALMRIPWFAWAYHQFMPWKEALEEYVRSSYVWRVARVLKARAKRAVAVQWQLLRPVLIRLRERTRLALTRLRVKARHALRRMRARWSALVRQRLSL